MQVKIEIIDTTNNSVITSEEFAQADSIVLSYSGSDDRHQTVVGSELQFSLLVANAADGQFSHLFTANENKYKTVFTNITENKIIWQGFLLAETYQEPYTTGSFFINFSAVDGLGFLKGKYFQKEFYKKEVSVIEILTKALNLTGLQLPLFFLPGIENTVEKDFTKIYIDLKNYADFEKDKFKSVYEIIDDIATSLVSMLYQQNGSWYFVGLNHRHLTSISVKKYNYNGVFVSTELVKRKVEYLRSFETPVISVVPKNKKIEVIHKLKKIETSKRLYKEENEGYASKIEVNNTILATKWQGFNGFFAYAKLADLQVVLPQKFDATVGETWMIVDENRYISLYEKLYVRKNTKIQFSGRIKIKNDLKKTSYNKTVDDRIKYRIFLNNAEIVGNFSNSTNKPDGSQIKFSENMTAEFSHTFVVSDFGFLDIRFYELKVSGQGFIGEIVFEKMEIKEVGKNTSEIKAEEMIDENHSIVKKIDLPISDDVSMLSNCFQLYKKRQKTTSYFTQNITVLYSFVYNQKKYNVVSLFDLMLINQNKDDLYSGSTKIEVKNIHFNFNGGEQMVFESATTYSNNTVLQLKVRSLATSTILPKTEQWADSLFKVESNRFTNAVAKVFKRIYGVEAIKIDATFSGLIDFETLINFHYEKERLLYPLNISWNVANNETTATLIESKYLTPSGEISGQNIPPMVNAGENILISKNQNNATLNAKAYDADGTIQSIVWEITPTATISNPNVLTPTISNLTADEYSCKITVTDNKGLSSSDVTKVLRKREYQIEFKHISGNKYKIQMTPQMLPSETALINVETFLKVIDTDTHLGDMLSPKAFISIVKNGFSIFNKQGGRNDEVKNILNISMISTDLIEVEVEASNPYNSGGSSAASIKINSVEFNSSSTVLSLPKIEKKYPTQ